TYSKYSSIDDKIDDLHYYTTFVKFGIGRATYDSSQEVRNGEITRDEALALIRRYDGEHSRRFEAENFAYQRLPRHAVPGAAAGWEQPLMGRAYRERLTNRSRSPHIWKHEAGGWKLRKAAYDPA